MPSASPAPPPIHPGGQANDQNNGYGNIHVGNNNAGNQGIIGGSNHSVNRGTVHYDTVNHGAVHYSIINYGTVNFNVVNYGTVSYGTVNVENMGKGELESMLAPYVSMDACYDSQKAPCECYSDTRVTVRQAINKWINDVESPILWLYGSSGVGKSVIAKTIAGAHRDRVVATFFFSTSSDRSGKTLIPTLALQLADTVPATKPHIIAALKKNCFLPPSEIDQQFKLLVAEPLDNSDVAPGHVFIIDGVDECTDEDLRKQLLKVLERGAGKGKAQLRFIICSRPEPSIHRILHKAHNNHAPATGDAELPADPSDHEVVPGWWQPNLRPVLNWVESFVYG